MTERRVGQRTVKITHADKVLFPDDGITKTDLVDYYAKVADVMLPHVRDRPLSQHRFPDGIRGEDFWHKQIPGFFPGWIDRVKVATKKGQQEQVLANEAATLAYLANQNCITPHVWLSRAGHLGRPDLLVFDLDPSTDDLGPVRKGARMLREILEDLDLVPYLKTTGSKGLHVTVPIQPKFNFEELWAFARDVAQLVVERDPNRFTIEFYKRKRGDRVFIDVNRNAYAQTAVPPYAVRAQPGAPVATPVGWDELGGLSPRKYTLTNMFRRLARREDPWADILGDARSIGPAARRLAGARR